MRKIFILLLFFSIISCTRSYMVKTDYTKMHVGQVDILAVAYHRPNYSPSERDDFKVKNRELDCQLPQELWKDQMKDQEKVRECLNSIENGKITYFFVPETQPYLELDQEEETNPKCLKEILPKIPLPREIYYLGLQDGKNADEDILECFSSSFSVSTNQIMMTPTRFLKKKIQIPFPLDRSLKSARDVSIWLMVTTFTILKSDDKAGGQLWGSQVPDSLCRTCFKNDALFDDKYARRIKPVFWP